MKEITDYFRRSDSLYHSTLGRRDLCDMVARMEAERGTCQVYLDGNENYKAYRCDACGMQAVHWGNYCPNCGRKVVEG